MAILNPWFISTPNYNEAQCQGGKALILPLWPGSPRHELAPGQEEEEEGGMPKAAAQSNAPPVHPGSARVSGRGWPLEREGRLPPFIIITASILLLPPFFLGQKCYPF